MLLLGTMVLFSSSSALAAGRNLTVSYSAVKQLPYAGSLIAWELLKDEGYNIDAVFMPRSELSVQALLQGESNFAQVNPIAATAAIHQGADLAIVAAIALNHWALVTPTSITDPSQLSGKRIAVHSETSMSNTVVQYAIQQEGIQRAQILLIPGSPARAQALMQGQVAGTSLFLTDAVRLEMTNPDDFHTLIDFTDMPVVDSVLVVRRDWARQNADVVRDVVRGLVQSHRRIQEDIDWAIEQALALYPEEEPDFVRAAVRTYGDRGVWDPNGGIPGEDAVAETIAFLKANGDLPPTASEDPADYADLSYLEAVLDEVGRWFGY